MKQDQKVSEFQLNKVYMNVTHDYFAYTYNDEKISEMSKSLNKGDEWIYISDKAHNHDGSEHDSGIFTYLCGSDWCRCTQ